MGTREGEKAVAREKERVRASTPMSRCARGDEKRAGTTVGLGCDCTRPANVMAGNSLGSPFFLSSCFSIFFSSSSSSSLLPLSLFFFCSYFTVLLYRRSIPKNKGILAQMVV